MSNPTPIENLEAPARELSPAETEEVGGGAGKASFQDLHFTPGDSAAGAGGGAGKVTMQDFHFTSDESPLGAGGGAGK